MAEVSATAKRDGKDQNATSQSQTAKETAPGMGPAFEESAPVSQDGQDLLVSKLTALIPSVEAMEPA